MKIALLGYGKMGKTIEQIALEKSHEIVFKSTSLAVEGDLSNADVAIEFSTPGAAVKHIKKALEANIPVVSGTTGWLEHYDEIINLCNKLNGTFLYASNFSVGVNIFFAINAYAAKLMQKFDEYEVSIKEIHHTQKIDAPSGTAISLAKDILKHSDKSGWILDEKNPDKLTISAIREEDVKGTHIITYQSEIDSIQLQHEAFSRTGFAKGAILAAEWIRDKQGVFSMKDVLKIEN
ncbi:MAG TPA: 4-hydroxy-tetrahydrodipicolinate reductase [Flavobacteriaceae bacterium]|nr:4-hydroxy-tetrahydrodipicolinate reductase [Flavobacteriaceae bacterium]